MSEYVSLGGDTGWTPGDVGLWNESQTGLALFGDLGKFNQDYGVWGAAQVPTPVSPASALADGGAPGGKRHGWGFGNQLRTTIPAESVQLAQQQLGQATNFSNAIASLESQAIVLRENQGLQIQLQEALEVTLGAIELLQFMQHQEGEELGVLLAIIDTYF